MSFRLLIITSLYSEFLKSYYLRFSSVKNESYAAQYDHLLNNTSEPVASYTRMFSKLGVSANCIIENAHYLQKQWALENGEKILNDKQLVAKQIQKFSPAVLWIENIEYLETGWINYLRSSNPGIKLIIASHCAPYNSRVIERFKNLDFIITCTPGLKNNFEKMGLKAYCVYHAFNPEILNKIEKLNANTANNLIFSGSLFMGGGYHDKRLELLERILEEDIDLKIYGNLEKFYKIKAKQSLYYTLNFMNSINIGGLIKYIPLLKKHEEYGKNRISAYSKKLIKSTESPVFGIEMYKLLRNADITLNIHGEVAGNYAGNLRLFEATGVGSCLLTDNKKNIEDLFVPGEEVVVYDSFDDCIEKIQWLLQNNNERAKIAERGQKKTLKDHTVEERCKVLIEIISKKINYT